MVVLTEEGERTMAIEVGVEEDSMVVVEVHTNSTLLNLNRITIQHRPLSLGVKPLKNERPTCQICGKAGHIAVDCYHRMDFAYQGKNPPTKLVAMASASNAALTNC